MSNSVKINHSLSEMLTAIQMKGCLCAVEKLKVRPAGTDSPYFSLSLFLIVFAMQARLG